MHRNAVFRCFVVFALSALVAQAEVRLPRLFTDHMVLQQETAVPVWGWADDGEKVTVEFAGQKHSTTAKGGKWMVKLRKLEASASPQVLKVSGDSKGKHSLVQVNDVLVGEVWIASGQSNMEWSLSRSHEPEKDIKSATNPYIRLFTVPKLKLNDPTNDVNAQWQYCTPETVPSFSAVAYYFGRDLQKALNVPIGLIHTSWGGSPAEVWIREEVLAGNPEFKADIVDKFAAQEANYKKAVAKYEQDRDAARKENKTFNGRRPSIWTPSELYNGMIAPLIPYAIQGAIWYQGESNAGRAWQYRRLLPAMIENWRSDWDREFTFLQVQLAPFDHNRKRSLEEITATPGDSGWGELREAQWLATKKLDKVGMAVITDVGDKDDIHPTKKEPAGARLALLARRIAYGEKIVASGPEFDDVKFRNGKAILSFKHVGGGLEARGGKLTGFAIAGEDQKFVWADAAIEDDKIVVSSPSVSKPAAVRFGWSDYPVVNLFNKAGLPATPFRTDDWQMTTRPKAQTAAAKK